MRMGRSGVGAFVLWTLSAAPAYAYPISPVTLWSLVERADTVVVGVVTRVEHQLSAPSPKVPLPLTYDRAHIEAHNTLKGEHRPQLQVRYFGNMACPAPPRYLEGELVLAFLARTGHGPELRTVGLSYGSLYPHFDELEAWEQVIREAVRVQSAGPVLPERRRRWLIKVAAQGPTRWHGAYELAPSADWKHRAYDRDQRDVSRLSDLDKAHLAAGLVKAPSLDRNFAGLLGLLRDHEDDRLDRVAVAAVDAIILRTGPTASLLNLLIPLTLERLGHRLKPATEPNRTGRGLEALLASDPLFAAPPSPSLKLVQAWMKTRKRLKDEGWPSELKVAFPYPRSPRVLGTGALTPP